MARISLDPPRTLSYRITEWFIRRRFGDMMDPVRALGHNRKVSRAYGLFESLVLRWNRVPRRLTDLAVMAAAVRIGCSWCVDFGIWESHTHGIPLEKIKAVPHWRESELFCTRERLVMEYAEAMTADPPGVTDELVDHLREFLDESQLVELTMIIAVENMRSRFNAAAGLAGQGFQNRCEVPAGQVVSGQVVSGQVVSGAQAVSGEAVRAGGGCRHDAQDGEQDGEHRTASTGAAT